MAIIDLKIKYNAILKKQDEAMAWFGSEDFHQKFKEKGAPFFDKCALRYKHFENMRIDTLDALEDAGAIVTIDNIVNGFNIKEG